MITLPLAEISAANYASLVIILDQLLDGKNPDGVVMFKINDNNIPLILSLADQAGTNVVISLTEKIYLKYKGPLDQIGEWQNTINPSFVRRYQLTVPVNYHLPLVILQVRDTVSFAP